jgi:hypothetical protein
VEMDGRKCTGPIQNVEMTSWKVALEGPPRYSAGDARSSAAFVSEPANSEYQCITVVPAA